MKNSIEMRSIKSIGLLLTFSLFMTACQEKIADAPIIKTGPAVKVQVQNVGAENNPAYFTASGKIEASKTVNVSTRMMGYIEAINAKVGDRVKKGQLLVRINDADLAAKRAQVDANINQAEVAFASAEKDYLRFKTLFQENSATQKELDDMTTRYNLAKSQIEAALQMKNEVNAQFSYANITAPITGIVTNKFVNAGDMANPGMPLLEIETGSQLQVVASVPESAISKVKLKSTVEVTIKSIDKTLKGKVIEVGSSAKYTGGQYLVKISLPEGKSNIRSGMYSTVKFPTNQTTNSNSAIYIPSSALVTEGQLSGVYTVSQSNTALLRWLRLGKQQGDKIEVLSGLAVGESYILSAEGKLFNGAKISK